MTTYSLPTADPGKLEYKYEQGMIFSLNSVGKGIFPSSCKTEDSTHIWWNTPPHTHIHIHRTVPMQRIENGEEGLREVGFVEGIMLVRERQKEWTAQALRWEKRLYSVESKTVNMTNTYTSFFWGRSCVKANLDMKIVSDDRHGESSAHNL